jgi:hypothetical protein
MRQNERHTASKENLKCLIIILYPFVKFDVTIPISYCKKNLKIPIIKSKNAYVEIYKIQYGFFNEKMGEY